MKLVISLIVLLLFSVELTHAAVGSRYQVILSRMPFGRTPVVAEPEEEDPLSAPLEPNHLLMHLRVCALTQEGTAHKVGLYQEKMKTSWYLFKGEAAHEGPKVMDVDFDAEKALIRYEGKERWLTLNAGTLAKTGSSSRGRASSGRTSSSSRSSTGVKSANSHASLLERIRQRREKAKAIAAAAQAPKKNPEPKLKGEELKKHLSNYNMELIRAGGQKGPPLPIQLTEEQDSQLVNEGVLPPR